MLVLRNIMVICYEELLIKNWNHSTVLWGSYQNNGVKYHWIIYVHSKAKRWMKNKFYNTVKFGRESEDIAAACVCPARSSVKCLGNAIMLVKFFLYWKILLEKN